MRIELNSRPNTIMFSAGVLALASLYIFLVQNHYRAATSPENIALDSLQRSVRLEPGNADSHDLLGRYYLYAAQDISKSASQFRDATRLNPHSSRYWMDLATVLGSRGDSTGQRNALQQALKVDPRTPSVAWETGNFLLMDGKAEAALDSFKTVIQYDPVLAPSALELCWRATHDVKMILDRAMPPLREPHIELIQLLYQKKETNAAMAAWRSLIKLNVPFKVQETMPLMEYLLQQQDIVDAQEVWKGMAKMSPSLQPSTSDGNVVVNGDFNEDIIPGGFSWHVEPPASRTLRIDDSQVHSGVASASFTFEGPSFSDYGFFQLVPVEPNALYELQVAAKSQEIESAEGPRLMVEDALDHTPLAKGVEWIGTHGWDDQKILFSTRPDTRMVKIYIGRTNGAGLVRGTLWLSNIRLYER